MVVRRRTNHQLAAPAIGIVSTESGLPHVSAINCLTPPLRQLWEDRHRQGLATGAEFSNRALAPFGIVGSSIDRLTSDLMRRRHMYTITHHYLTIGDDGLPIVEKEQRAADDPSDIADIVRAIVEAPGGRSGTTIHLSVSLDESASI